MNKALLMGMAAAALAGVVIGILNKFVGGPMWLVGGLAGFVGALVCGTVYKKESNKQ